MKHRQSKQASFPRILPVAAGLAAFGLGVLAGCERQQDAGSSSGAPASTASAPAERPPATEPARGMAAMEERAVGRAAGAGQGQAMGADAGTTGTGADASLPAGRAEETQGMGADASPQVAGTLERAVPPSQDAPAAAEGAAAGTAPSQ